MTGSLADAGHEMIWVDSSVWRRLVEQLESINRVLGLRHATSLKFVISQSINKRTGATMPGTLSVTDDHDIRVPLKFSDDVGVIAHAPAGTTVSSDNTAVISGGDVAADGASVVLRTAGDGACNVTVTNGALSDTIAVTVGEPIATALAADAADATQVAKGSPA